MDYLEKEQDLSASKQRLYDLLPTYIRFRDQQLRDLETGIAPLEALIETLELPFHALEENIDALYRGWFIETCDPWKIPYLADLLDVHGIDEAGDLFPSHRRRVANAIAYRRRKGTSATLARVAEDATGWPCHVTEERDRIATSQSLEVPNAERLGVADLRSEPAIGAFEEMLDPHPHSVDLRRGSDGVLLGPTAGLRPDGLGFNFFRLDSYPMHGASARPDSKHPDRCYRFHPAGVDTLLFNAPRTPHETVYRTEAKNLPLPLWRRVLKREMKTRQRGESPATSFLGDPSAFCIQVCHGAEEPWEDIGLEAMEICDLSQWRSPSTAMPREAKVAVDPETGRIAFPKADPTRQVRVDFSFGGSRDMGGGPYPRSDRPRNFEDASWRAIVDCNQQPSIVHGIRRFASLENALADLQASQSTATVEDAVIRIDDNGHHPLEQAVLELGEDQKLTIRSGERVWPQLLGDLKVKGEDGSRLVLDGVGVEGRLMLDGDPSLALCHCTLRPPEGAAIDHSGSRAPRHGEVTIDQSIVTGPVHLPASIAMLSVTDSILDAGTGEAICGKGHSDFAVHADFAAAAHVIGALPGPPLRIDRSTVLGSASVLQLRHAANTLFTGPVKVARTQEGRAKHCYFVTGSVTPPRWHCLEGPRSPDGGWLRPSFTSITYGHPAYLQLSPCSGEIRSGGEQGHEIGVFHSLAQESRMDNLRRTLDDYLPAGFTHRITFVT